MLLSVLNADSWVPWFRLVSGLIVILIVVVVLRRYQLLVY
jgi:hypothetical protein